MNNNIMDDFKSDIQIGAWVPATKTEEQVKGMADVGIDFIFVAWSDDKASENMLKWCEKYSIKCIIHEANIYGKKNGLETEEIKQTIDRYINNPIVIGNSFYDEPGLELYEKLGQSVKNYNKVSSGKHALVNLFPIYADKQQLGTDSYNEYVSEFVRLFDTDYICADVYPLTNEKTTIPSYLKNLDILGTAARESGRDFWIFVQSMPFNNMRAPSEEDMRFQVYSCFSFGAKNILHFCYATPPSGAETFPYAMVDLNGEKTHLWYTAQKINKEIKMLSPIYMKYKNLGAYVYKTDIAPQYLEFDNVYEGFDTIKNLKSDRSLLIGCFEKKAGEGKAFTLVNMSELKDNLPAKISFEIANVKCLTAYIKGKPKKLKNNQGQFNITLESGEGVFVTIDE